MKRKEEKRMDRLMWTVVMVLFMIGGMMTACTDYQDEVDSLDRRVTKLEELIKRANADLEAMEVVLAAIQDGDYITGVRDTDDGYVVNFKKAGPIYLYDGKDGRDGKDAQMPDVDVARDADGNFYWVIDGKPLTDADGKTIRVNGRDGKDGRDGVDGRDGIDGKDGKDGIDGKDGENGKDGKDGQDGQDAVSPQLRINPTTLMWEISIDNGTTWQPTGTSAQGKDGKDGNEFFYSVNYEVTAEGEFMTVVTKSGQTFRIPIHKNA